MAATFHSRLAGAATAASVLGLLALAVSCGSDHGGRPAAGLPKVIDCPFDPALVRPQNLVLACADQGVRVQKITWRRWDATGAEGDGTEYDNTCEPSCSAGSMVTKTVHVVLSDLAQPGNVFTHATTIDHDGRSSTHPLTSR